MFGVGSGLPAVGQKVHGDQGMGTSKLGQGVSTGLIKGIRGRDGCGPNIISLSATITIICVFPDPPSLGVTETWPHRIF